MTAPPLDNPADAAARASRDAATMPPARSAGRPANASTRREADWVSLWRRVRQARDALRTRSADVARIDAAVRTDIEPRERRFTAAAIALTGTLIDRYTRDAPDAASRSLLGLWISENLELLEDHPFVDADALLALSRRWRTALDRALDRGPNDPDDPTARALSRLGRSRRAGGDDRTASRAGTGADDDPAVSASSGPGPDRSGAVDVDALLLDAGDGRDKADAVAALIARLFRRLAQALHPDREPDVGRRRIKQTLMGDALEARAAADLDRLLSLHIEHVGDPLDGADAATLERALRRQLEAVNRALARVRGTDPLRRRMLERYGLGSGPASEAAIARHADALDRAIATLRREHEALLDPSGLDAALEERREREQDRLAIDELTGMR